ncbi:uncharacterized protein LOC132296264 [Cornus florida]|uniref:uncharacterized protein LOC132296264 n=1 Tax=Cornus florida TaxID=4283 RepID=UPI0028A2309E|nr:uncharacterized protein LOC132296264 [Cornus florida]
MDGYSSGRLRADQARAIVPADYAYSTKDQPLLLYVTSTPQSIGALLTQEIGNQERSIYYISHLIRDAEERYSLIEKHCFALVFAAHKFRHYFLAYRIILITKCDPYRHLLSKPMLTAHELVDEQLPLDDLQVASLEQAQEWHLSFDGSSTTKGGGAGIVLSCPTLTFIAAVKLDFKCTNNEAEYEALILGLLTALDKQVSRLCIDGDSKLIVKQTSDALATLASKLDISGPTQQITVHKQTQPAIASLLPLEDISDWRRPIIYQMQTFTGSLPLTQLKCFHLIQGVLYHRSPLASSVAVSGTPRLVKFFTVFISNNAPLLISLFTGGSSAKAITGLKCPVRLPHCSAHVLLARNALMQLRSSSSNNPTLAAKLKHQAPRFQVCDGSLFRLSREGHLLRFLAGAEIREALHQAHSLEHQGAYKLFQHLIHKGLYWPTMEYNAKMLVQRCQLCQYHHHRIHTPPTVLHPLAAPWPFHTWGLDLIGPINPTVHQMHWILTATDFFSKWAEAFPLRHATGIAVTAFISENIICWFGIPAIIFSDNGTPFVNYWVAQLLQQYNITQRRSSAYYLKGNGQAEATNKSLLKIISRTVAEHKSNWVD